MAQKSDIKHQIAINGLPEGYGLSRTQNLLHEYLETEDAIVKIEFAENHDGTEKQSIAIVTLKEDKYVQCLIKKAVIDALFHQKGYQFTITKARPRIKSDTSRALETAGSTSLSTISPVYQNVTRDPRQRTLYCTNIPSHMLNETRLDIHFKRYGVIHRIYLQRQQRRSFAIIEYELPQSALEAFHHGRKVGPNIYMSIYWDKREAEMLQRQDCYPSMSGQHFVSSSTNPKMRMQNEQIQQLKIFSWQEILQFDEEIFSNFQNRCVLVQGVSERTSSSLLRSHFEDPGASGGGLIHKIFRLPDGILIAFQEQNSANGVLLTAKHCLDSKDLQLFAKPVPRAYDKQFLVEGKFADKDTLLDLVGCCLSPEFFSVEKIDGCDRYIVSIKNDCDDDIKEVMKKIGDIGLQLEDVKQKVVHLCATDCVKVVNIADIKNDKIRLTFMNKSLTENGTITLIQRDMDNDMAYVYFADYQDAEKVAENSRKNKVQFGNKAISISLCYYNPSAAKDEHEKKGLQSYSGRTKELRQTFRPFDFLSEAECDVIQFIQKSQTDMEAMTKEFENLANVKFQPKRLTGRNCPSQYIIRFQPLPVKYRTNGQQINQKSFESECKSKIMAFLEKYTVRVGKFDPRDLDNICKSNSWRNQSDITLIEIDQRRSVSVFARWNHPKDGDFTIAGQETEVSQAFKWLKALEEKEKKTEMFEIIKEWQLEFLKDCGIVDDMTSRFKDTTISIVDEDYKVIFTGSRTDVDACRTETMKQLKKIDSSRLTFLDEDKLDFLTQALKPGRSSEFDIAQLIKVQFRQAKLKCILQGSVEPKLRYIHQRELDIAITILDDFIQRCSIPVKAGLGELISSTEWKKFEGGLCSSGALVIKINLQNSCIELLGVAKLMEEGEYRLTKYVMENAVGNKVIKMPYAVARFLSEYPNEVKLEEELKSVEWHMTTDNDFGILVQGKADHVKSAIKRLTELIPKIETATHGIKELGMSGYFRSETGAQFLKTTQALTKCTILIDPDQIQQRKNVTTSSKLMEKTKTAMLSAQISNTNVTVRVIKNDITTHATDAIVNASNKELELRNAGVSGSIFNKVGKAIQQEMTIQKRKIGRELAPGCAVTTTAGSLPCKKVIHAVGPMWHSSSESWAEQSLKDAIKACLSEADQFNLKSIAIPAISCGVFGGKPEICSKLIVQAIVEYFHEMKSSSSIRQVDLIELSNPNILACFKKQVASIILGVNNNDDRSQHKKGFGETFFQWFSSGKSATSKADSNSSNPSANPGNQISFFHPLQVTVKQGDLLMSTSDVIVNLTGPSFDLNGGQLSSKLIAKAGQTVVQECASNPCFSTSNCRVTRGGKLSCQYVVHLMANQDVSKSLQEVFSVVNKQLKCSSLALPAIGTGNRGFTSTGVAKATRDALHDFSKTKPSHLRRIEIVVFQNSMLSDFQSIISRISTGSSVNQKREPEKRESIFPKEGVGQKGESIKLLFCAAHKININNAWQRVKEHIHDKSATKVLEDEVVVYLDHFAEKKLIDIGEKYNVHLRKTSEASGKDKIIISGIKDNVFDAHVAASDIVREYAQIIAIAEYVIWQYYDLQSHTFVDFSQRDSWKTELAHKKNDKGGTTLALKVGSQKRTFDLDFTNMEESCRESRSKTKIRRGLASQESDDLPETWTDMGGRPWKLETLPQQSTEYQTVLKKYANKGLNISQQCQVDAKTFSNLFHLVHEKKSIITTVLQNLRTVTYIFGNAKTVRYQKVLL
ncbi:unnamed protein product [Clavelina lepadiformis]|uniref:Poly [ADP-ribose] polymerase n=1 Tax=Clavelina lepadiformis TaxID=159417 RepID=A0ABP0GZK8_CLALP